MWKKIKYRLHSIHPVFWIWSVVALGIAFVLSIDLNHPGESLCYSQQVFGVACPACGMGRAFNSLLHVHLTDALAFNPLVYPAALFVTVLLIASLYDAIKGTTYTRFFMNFRLSKPIAAIAIVLVLLVWIRNLLLY